MTAPTLYAASTYSMTRRLAHDYAEAGSRFGKTELNARTEVLKAFVLSRWNTW